MATETIKRPRSKRSRRTTPNCLLCDWADTKLFRTGIREDTTRPVYICSRCQLRFLKPPKGDLRDYYRTEYRLTHDHVTDKVLTPEERFQVQRPLMNKRESFFREHVPKGAMVLEIGCSAGAFLDTIQNDYSVFGNEWNPEDAAFVRDIGELPCEEGDLDDVYPGQQFTAICAYHVLEHQPDPIAWLRKVKSRLIGGGWLILELPNAEDALVGLYDIPAFRDRWYQESHISYFSLSNLAAALAFVGFEAKVTTRQEYGMLNHTNWFNKGGPMDVHEARSFAHPVPESHPAEGILNRWWAQRDQEYRVMLETIKAGNILVGIGQRREI